MTIPHDELRCPYCGREILPGDETAEGNFGVLYHNLCWAEEGDW